MSQFFTEYASKDRRLIFSVKPKPRILPWIAIVGLVIVAFLWR